MVGTVLMISLGDDLIEVQKGNIAGHALVHKFGRNAAVPDGSWEFVNLLGFTAWPLSAATTVRIKAGGNAADTAAGAGAREVTVQGIDASFNEVTETIATAGASASSATTTSFWRVHRAWVSAVGTYGAANTAAIDIENSAGGTDLIRIGADEGQTLFAAWTVPTGKTAYLLSLDVTVATTASVKLRLLTRANIDDTSAPMSAKRVKLFFGLSGDFSLYKPRSPSISIAGKSDVWVEAQGVGAVAAVTCDFELLVADD